ncbi:hypothetical protein [Pseudomonas oryzihabitans]|uniref:hypothetical protein n=1 Tax=Pseudomonas oryzihabitans TaxID=47885 RepID=UPI00289395D2|nr:hypothetical protein [Pseudomonas oryzihabitans]MDT3723159.1 hypothetical protein [Pseudomonas oryzihabitans]
MTAGKSAIARSQDQQAVTPAATQKAVAATQGERVSISDEARAALASSTTAYDAIANNPDPTISVKQYAIPDWYADLLVDTAKLPGSPGYSMSDNSTTSKLMSADSGTRNEYFKLIMSHYEKIQKDNGITNQADHYNSLIADKATSEKLRLQFQQSVQSDTRLVELMQKIGIRLS